MGTADVAKAPPPEIPQTINDGLKSQDEKAQVQAQEDLTTWLRKTTGATYSLAERESRRIAVAVLDRGTKAGAGLLAEFRKKLAGKQNTETPSTTDDDGRRQE